VPLSAMLRGGNGSPTRRVSLYSSSPCTSPGRLVSVCPRASRIRRAKMRGSVRSFGTKESKWRLAWIGPGGPRHGPQSCGHGGTMSLASVLLARAAAPLPLHPPDKLHPVCVRPQPFCGLCAHLPANEWTLTAQGGESLKPVCTE